MTVDERAATTSGAKPRAPTPKELARRAFLDPVFFCRFFFPHLFSEEIPWVHRGLLAVLTGKTKFLEKYGELERIEENFTWLDRNGTENRIFYRSGGRLRQARTRFSLVMLPRGFSKTTIAGNIVPLYNILFQVSPFTVYVSHAALHAKMQLTNVKLELSDNERLLAVFGELKPGRDSGLKWSEDFFETTTGMAMAARGQGGQIRGLLHKGSRPTRIIVDDVEDQESVATEPQREKVRHWAYGDLIPALDRTKRDASISALGTLLHPDSLLMRWRSDPKWTAVHLGALDARGDPVWPFMMDHDQLEIEKQSFAINGQLHTFYMEYFNEIVAPETQKFKPHYITHAPPEGDLLTAIYVDPAISQARTADSSVIVVAGMNASGIIWVLDCWGKRGATPREVVDAYFELAIRWSCSQCGVESIAYQAALVHLLKEEMFRKGHFFEVIEVKHARRGSTSPPAKKEERILQILQPRYASGYMRHARSFPDLETQLLEFRVPSTGRDDYPDALAGAVSLLDPYAGQAADLWDLSSDEFPPLKEVLKGEWRWA